MNLTPRRDRQGKELDGLADPADQYKRIAFCRRTAAKLPVAIGVQLLQHTPLHGGSHPTSFHPAWFPRSSPENSSPSSAMAAAEANSSMENMTAISEASSHFPDNVRQLTPIEDLHSLRYHDKEYLDTVISKANRGDTFFPETVDIDRSLANSTPSPKKLERKFDYNASTPLKGGLSEAQMQPQPQLQASRSSQFSFPQKPRNIFNLSPEFVSLQPGLKGSTNIDGSINPVKGAFNLFDKSASFASGNNSSLGSRSFRRPRKRVRGANVSDISFDLTNNSSRLSFPRERRSNNESSFVSHSHSKFMQGHTLSTAMTQQRGSMSRYDYIHSLISDPQCVSNLTLLIQILLNTLMVLVFLGFSLVAFFAIKRDVDHKISSYVNDAIHKINSCKREYFRNNCAPEMRVPALEYKCNEWDTCMGKDPQSVITSMAYFEVMADCMNAFFHNISIKSLLGIGCLMLFCIIVPNILFSKFRSTTIHQNYYNGNNSHIENDTNDMLNIQTSSPMKPSGVGDQQQRVLRSAGNSTFFSPVTDKVKKPASASDHHNDNNNVSGSVRFNPNVSYSMYDYEDDSNDRGNFDVVPNQRVGDEEDNSNGDEDQDNGNNNDNEDDEDENLLANQRILLED